MHYRLEPKKNRFSYKIFMFGLDLDEIDSLARRLWLFSRNRFNLFNFRDSDHLEAKGRTIKENIVEFAATHGIDLKEGKVFLVTHLRTLGYSFNPVCFYFCVDKAQRPLGAVVEVENTYHEKKRYWLGEETLEEGKFHQRVAKYFYVSPFTDLDDEFEFKLTAPSDSLNLFIDDWKQGRKFLLTSLTGKSQELTDWNLFWNTVQFPLITLQVIFLIHWQALILKLKGLPHLRKADHPELQREVYHAKLHS